jgi:hypothetical protein
MICKSLIPPHSSTIALITSEFTTKNNTGGSANCYFSYKEQTCDRHMRKFGDQRFKGRYVNRAKKECELLCRHVLQNGK